jgi:hypothetical protein
MALLFLIATHNGSILFLLYIQTLFIYTSNSLFAHNTRVPTSPISDVQTGRPT